MLDQAAERSGNKYSFYILIQFPRENVETKLIETIKSDTVLSSNELVKDALTNWKQKSVRGSKIDLPLHKPLIVCNT